MSWRRLPLLLVVLASAAGCRANGAARADPLSVIERGEAQWQDVVVDEKHRPAGDGEDICWPLHAALREAAPTGYRDCSEDPAPLACMARARQAGEATVLLRVGFGEDSMYGWAVLQRSDGSLTRYSYDSSPCGGVVPSACGYRLQRAECEAVSAALPDPAQQRALCDKPYFGAKQK